MRANYGENTFLITKEELNNIYDLMIKIGDEVGDVLNQLDEEENDLSRAYNKLDDYYCNIMVDCGLLVIEED